MKELTRSLAQLFAIIVLMITFAVSITAFSLWADSGAPNTTAPQTAQTARLHAGVP